VPKSVVKSELESTSVEKWQSEWVKTTKGKITKDYFPEVAWKLNNKIRVYFTPNLTTMITGHGNIKTYLHKFKIIDSPKCPCGHNDQTTDHILLECTLLNKEKDSLISAVWFRELERWTLSKTCQLQQYFR
jgi:hypothetical protein